jgi:hypothetical protein
VRKGKEEKDEKMIRDMTAHAKSDERTEVE